VIFVGCVLAAAIVFAALSGNRFILLALAGPAAIAFLVWAVRGTMSDPSWLIFALVLGESLPYLNLWPVEYNSRWWIHYPILLGFGVPATFRAWKTGAFRRGYLIGYIVFLAWATFSVTYSASPKFSIARIVPAALLFGSLSLIATRVCSTQDIQRVLQRYLAANAILIALNLVAAIAFPHNIAIDSGDGSVLSIGIFTWTQYPSGFLRFSGFSTGPNAIGGLMAGTMCAGLAHWHAVGRRRRRALACIMAISVFLAVMADSRTPFVAVATGLGAICVWKYRLRGFIACAFVVALFGVIYVALGPAQKEYFNREAGTFTGRTTEWRFELRKLAERPLLGYGFKTEGVIFEDRYFPEWSAFSGGVREDLQNGYLSVALGLGIPALIFWLFIYLMPWVTLFGEQSDQWHLKPTFFLIVLPGLVYALSESSLAEPGDNLLGFLFWILAERYRLVTRATKLSQRFDLRSASSGAVNFQRLFAP
jgi:O-antigen ligase